jgi:hypothetical protein
MQKNTIYRYIPIDNIRLYLYNLIRNKVKIPKEDKIMTTRYSTEYLVNYDKARRDEAIRMNKAMNEALGIEEEKKPEVKSFKKGDKVNHPKYGVGTVFATKGAFVTVKYGKEKKQFLANFLEPA